MKFVSLVCGAVLAFASVAAYAQELSVRPEVASGIYKAGDTAKWIVELKPDPNQPLTNMKYRIKKGGLTILREGELQLTDNHATLEAASDEPGWLLLEIDAQAGEKKVHKAGGAIFSPEQIKPSSPTPTDFDEFWNAKLKELAAVPMEPAAAKGESGKPNVDYYEVTLKNIRGTLIHGQLARPTAGDKFPALLIVQWAGVYPLQKPWVTDRAAEGWLALNIQAHDLPVAENAEFYKQQNEGPLKSYPSIGADDRDTSYFLRMYLSCYRAAEYLTTRPDWNGQVLVVTGGSQGGLQALLTAAIFPKVTAAMASVPAGCDHTGPDAGRIGGWPQWHWQAKGRDPEKIRQASRYYDIINFTPRIKCPVLVGIGGIDTTCPAPGIFAAVNQMSCPKEVVFEPLANHMGDHAPYYARLGPWMSALKSGKPAPVK